MAKAWFYLHLLGVQVNQPVSWWEIFAPKDQMQGEWCGTSLVRLEIYTEFIQSDG